MHLHSTCGSCKLSASFCFSFYIFSLFPYPLFSSIFAEFTHSTYLPCISLLGTAIVSISANLTASFVIPLVFSGRFLEHFFKDLLNRRLNLLSSPEARQPGKSPNHSVNWTLGRNNRREES
jgi:hypothetical protein